MSANVGKKIEYYTCTIYGEDKGILSNTPECDVIKVLMDNEKRRVLELELPPSEKTCIQAPVVDPIDSFILPESKQITLPVIKRNQLTLPVIKRGQLTFWLKDINRFYFFLINPNSMKISKNPLLSTVLSAGGYRTHYWESLQMINETWSGSTGNLTDEHYLNNFLQVEKLVTDYHKDIWLGFKYDSYRRGIITSFNYDREASSALSYNFSFTFLAYPEESIRPEVAEAYYEYKTI